MQDLIRQRLQPGDKIRVNDKARKKHLVVSRKVV